MQRLGQLVIGLVVAGIVFWIGWTSPSLKQCLQEAYYNNPQQPLQEYVTNLYGSFVGYRLCVGNFVHANGDGIIAIFTVILGIATWFLWRATRDLVEDARVTSTNQLEVTKISSNAAKTAAENIPIVERAYVYPRIVEERIFEAIIKVQNGMDPTSYIPRVGFAIKNYGKTAAFITQINGLLHCASNTSVVRDTDDWHISNDFALEPNGSTETFYTGLNPPLTKEEADGIVDGTAKLYFSGWVVFKDVWGIDDRVGDADDRWQHFTWTWNHTKRRMVAHIPPTHVAAQ